MQLGAATSATDVVGRLEHSLGADADQPDDNGARLIDQFSESPAARREAFEDWGRRGR